jgi:hypothetical protein
MRYTNDEGGPLIMETGRFPHLEVSMTTIRAEVFDGRGIAHIWTVREIRSGRTEFIECIGTVVGVHTQAEAIEAAKREGII